MAPQASHQAPPALPPSVEEAYRRKCVQLKQRINEVDEANDAARLRLARIKRQVEKQRIERAFLLEQLARRTSTNVEDSEGSPSPPPTPKEKPLRTKRGHRKTSVVADPDADADSKPASSTFISQNISALSPSSESFPQPPESQDAGSGPRRGGRGSRPERPASAFEMWSEDARKRLAAKHEGDDDFNLDEELAREWKHLDQKEKDEWSARHQDRMLAYQKEKDAYKSKQEAAKAERKEAEAEAEAEAEVEAEVEVEVEVEADAEENPAKDKDEDVEMANYDTEEQDDTQAADKTDD